MNGSNNNITTQDIDQIDITQDQYDRAFNLLRDKIHTPMNQMIQMDDTDDRDEEPKIIDIYGVFPKDKEPDFQDVDIAIRNRFQLTKRQYERCLKLLWLMIEMQKVDGKTKTKKKPFDPHSIDKKNFNELVPEIIEVLR